MKIFFVYLYKHPITSIPFYVGKGKGARHLDHLKMVGKKYKQTICVKTCAKIIQETGLSPIVEIIQSDMSEEDAYALETRLIEKYGRKHYEGGTLVNHSKGGEFSAFGLKWSEKSRAKLSNYRKGRSLSLETRKRYLRV